MATASTKPQAQATTPTADQDALLAEFGMGGYDDEVAAEMDAEISIDDFTKMMKWAEGRNLVRVIPALKGPDGKAKHFRKTYVHFFDRPDGQTVTFACAVKEVGRPCIGCEQSDKLRASSDPIKIEMGKKLRCRPTYYANVIQRGEQNEAKGVQVAPFSRALMIDLNKKFKHLREEISLDPLNPFQGRDIMVERTGTGRDTEWSVSLGQLSKPILPAWKGMGTAELREAMTNILENCIDLEKVAAVKERTEIEQMILGAPVVGAGAGGARQLPAGGGKQTIEGTVVSGADEGEYEDDFEGDDDPDNIPF